MVLESLLGSYLAASVDESVFRKAAAVLFLFMIATVFVDAKMWAKEKGVGKISPKYYPVYFLMGIYGGGFGSGGHCQTADLGMTDPVRTGPAGGVRRQE